MTDPLPPHSVEAEEAVLGSLCIDPDAIYQVSDLLSPADFYLVKLSYVYEAILSLHQRGEPWDYLTLCEELKSKGRLEEVGGPAELTRLLTAPPTALHIASYARIVAACAVRRRLCSAAQEVYRMAYSADGDVDTLVSDARARFEQAMPRAKDGAHLRGDDALLAYEGLLWDRKEALDKDPDALVKTGWDDVDKWLFFGPGILVVVGGPPGVGKTMFMECVAEYNAQRGKHVVFYHFELSHDTMLDRRMARHSGVPYAGLRLGAIGDDVHRATISMSEWQHNIDYVHCPGWTMERVCSDLVRMSHEWGIDLACVDYLQKAVVNVGRGENVSNAVAGVVERLKSTIEQLGIPAILGSQVNRGREVRPDHKAHIGDLRNSGEIAEKANAVVMLHRDEQDKGMENILEVYAEKQTLGEWGTCYLQHHPGLYRLDTVEVRREKLVW